MNDKSQPSGSRAEDCQAAARLVVWERDGIWARHLRHELGPDGVRVFECRTRNACRRLLGESPASLVVLQWTEAVAAEVLGLLAAARYVYPNVRFVVVAGPGLESLGWRILEAGAVWYCTSPRRLGPVVEIVRRHFEQVPRANLTIEERVQAELPWPENATPRQRAAYDV